MNFVQYRGVTFDKDPLEGVPVRLYLLGYKWMNIKSYSMLCMHYPFFTV
jgi:hypothetical protein